MHGNPTPFLVIVACHFAKRFNGAFSKRQQCLKCHRILECLRIECPLADANANKRLVCTLLGAEFKQWTDNLRLIEFTQSGRD